MQTNKEGKSSTTKWIIGVVGIVILITLIMALIKSQYQIRQKDKYQNKNKFTEYYYNSCPEGCDTTTNCQNYLECMKTGIKKDCCFLASCHPPCSNEYLFLYIWLYDGRTQTDYDAVYNPDNHKLTMKKNPNTYDEMKITGNLQYGKSNLHFIEYKNNSGLIRYWVNEEPNNENRVILKENVDNVDDDEKKWYFLPYTYTDKPEDYLNNDKLEFKKNSNVRIVSAKDNYILNYKPGDTYAELKNYDDIVDDDLQIFVFSPERDVL